MYVRDRLQISNWPTGRATNMANFLEVLILRLGAKNVRTLGWTIFYCIKIIWAKKKEFILVLRCLKLMVGVFTP